MTPRHRGLSAGRKGALAVLSCALVLVAALFALAAPARAAKASYTSDGFTYRILEDADGSEVHVFATSLEGHVTIPATLGDSPVTVVGSKDAVGFGAENVVDAITFSEGIRTVEDHAFDNWRDFDGAYIPRSLEYAGSRSFWIEAPSWTVYYGGTRAEWDALLARSADDCGLDRDNVIAYFQCSEYGDVTGEEPSEPEDPTPPEEPDDSGEPTACGRYLEDGEYPIRFRTDSQQHDITHDFRYSEDFFAGSAMDYDHDLAMTTLGLVVSGFSTRESDAYYTVDGNVGREDNIRDAYETLGFAEAEFHNYDVSLNDTSDKVAYSFARKTYERDGETITVVPVILRGGGYGAEWVSNFHVRESSSSAFGVGEHYGFARAADQVYVALKQYLHDQGDEELGTVKLWIGGYSRSAAVANLLTGKICNRLSTEMKLVGDEKNVFAYTFATPNALTAGNVGNYMWKYCYNYVDGITPTIHAGQSNLHNIVYSADAVPRVPLDDWGYHRNGNDYYLPATRASNDVHALSSIYYDITGVGFDFSELASVRSVLDDEGVLASICDSASWYEEHYQRALMDVAQYVFSDLSTGTSPGYVEDEVAKIALLDGIDASEEDIRGAIAASAIVLVGYEDKLGLSEEQIASLIPIGAIALLDGAGDDLIGVLVQNALIGVLFEDDLISSVETDGVAMGHYPEVYLALMQYYGEEGYDPAPKTWVDPLSFYDVDQIDWFAPFVGHVTSRGIMSGYGDSSNFGPNDSMERQDVAQMLYNWLAPDDEKNGGESAGAANETGLSDVADGAYYTAAVNWCVESGVFTGYASEGRFGVGDVITREQFATVLYRALGAGASVGLADGFPDAGNVSSWARDAMAWAVDEGIITGSGGRLLPQGSATRAEIATMVARAD